MWGVKKERKKQSQETKLPNAMSYTEDTITVQLCPARTLSLSLSFFSRTLTFSFSSY